ncbi:MAG: hypothetical protein AAF962_06425 [Actinomycetota bacterium]
MSTADDTAPDPGWMQPLRKGPWVLIPVIGLRLLSRTDDGTTTSLERLRQIFISYLVGLVGILLVGIAVTGGGAEDAEPALSSGQAFGLNIVVGVLALGAIVAIRRRTPTCGDDETLINGYSSRFLVSVVLALLPVLAAFVGSLLAQSPAPMLGGAVISFFWLLVVAPTATDLAAVQQRLDAAGCDRSLTGALASPVPGA